MVDNSVTRTGQVHLPLLVASDMHSADVPGVIQDHQAAVHGLGNLSPGRYGVTLHREVHVDNRPAEHRVPKSPPYDEDREAADCEEVAQALHQRWKLEAARFDGRTRCDRLRAQ